MHSMPAVTASRNGKFHLFQQSNVFFCFIAGKYLAFQSMDNQIRIMEPLANFRWKSKKIFKGHMVGNHVFFSLPMNSIIILHHP